MINAIQNCPVCNSTVVQAGRLLQGEYPAGLFVPDAIENKFLFSASPGISIPYQMRICLDCGLSWQQCNQQQINELKQFIKNNA